jgi:hypothetical protein
MVRSTAELAAREMATTLDAWEAGVRTMPGAWLRRERDLAWFSSGLREAFLNEVLVRGPDVPAAVLRRAVAEMRATGNPFIARARVGTDDEVMPGLQALGLREADDAILPGMALDPLDAEALAGAALPPGVGLDRVTDGTAVGTSMAWTAGDTVGVYNVTTLESNRGRGVGAALTRAAVLDGGSRGATVAILQASGMGRGLYEAMGFRVVVRYRVFVGRP